MKSIEIVGFKRANLGKTTAKAARENSNVPCVLYGGKEQHHFEVPMSLFKDLVYTPKAHLVDLNIEGTKFSAMLQDVQFHPVSEMLMHADFMQIFEDKEVKMDVPVKLVGTPEGVSKGGKLVQKLRKLKIKALPKDLPDFIELDVTALDLGKTYKVSQIKPANFVILNVLSVPVVTIDIPRALKGKQAEAS